MSGGGDLGGTDKYQQQDRRRISTTSTANEEGVAEEIVATADMCHHCFDILLKELLPDSSMATHRGRSKSQGKGSKRRLHTTKNKHAVGTHSSIDDADADGMQEQHKLQSPYTPPTVDCPLFVTWSKSRSSHPPPVIKDDDALSISSGLATPATVSNITDSSHITDSENDENTTLQHQQQIHQQYADEYDLRGCIGTLAPKTLTYALSEFALTSALQDHRFNPISLHELPFLKVGVSLLVKYETCSNCHDWEVGVHGIIIKFVVKEKHYSATYLPEVADGQCWDQKETVISLIRKAGYRGTITDTLLDSIHCTRYQSSKYQISYQEYCYAMRQQLTVHQGSGRMTMDQDANSMITSAIAIDEAVRQQQRIKSSSRPCVNL